MSPLVSVIIPVYNGENYLAKAIESVLAQTYSPHEIIVIDDGSTDSSAEIARRFPVRLITRPNGGISAARNSGIDVSQGEFIALLDADDLWLPDKSALQVQALEQDAALEMVFGHVREFVSPELPADIAVAIPHQAQARPGMMPSATMVRRAAMARIGPFETHWTTGEFAAWILRANEANVKHTILPELVALRRLHTANNGIKNRAKFVDYAQIIKASLDRRRAAESRKP